MFQFLHSFQPSPIIISFGWAQIYWYGLFIVLGVLAALTVAMKLAKKIGLSPSKIFDMAFWLIISGILGARIYHVFLEWGYYHRHFWDIFKLWQGGLAIHGALLAGILMVIFFARREKISFWKLTAVMAPGIALGQAIGRWGNYFNQELFGKPTDLPWGIPISLMNRPDRYLGSDYFHPTFLYESLGNLAIFFLLLYLFNRIVKNKKENYKMILLVYVLAYSALRFTMEFIRTDQTLLFLGFRWPQIFSLLIIITALVLMFFPKKKPEPCLEQK